MEWKPGWTIDRFAVELVVECEAFLNGSYAERLQATGRRVPGWG